MFRTETRYDQAYLVMYILYFMAPLLLLGALVGIVAGISVWLLGYRRKNGPGLIKRLLVSITFAMLIGALVALYFGEGNKTLEYWLNFTVVVLVFGFAVGGVGWSFCGNTSSATKDRRQCPRSLRKLIRRGR